LGAFWELFGHLGGTLGHLWQPWGSLGVTWEPFGRTFWEDLASLDALGLKIVPGLLKVTLFSGFLCLLKDLVCFLKTFLGAMREYLLESFSENL
jgi:hypothetical protein